MASIPITIETSFTCDGDTLPCSVGPEWHRVLNLRTAIFVVEQSAPIKRSTRRIQNSWHLELSYASALIGTLRRATAGAIV